jgi:lysozyme
MAGLPSRTFLRASLALWKRREHYRKRRHDHWQRLVRRNRRPDLVAKRDHWSRLLKQARAMIEERARQLATPTNARGVDVSNNNGHVDFVKIRAAGYSFVWLKASEGTTFTDAFFLDNAKRAKAAGLRVGAYHFLNAANAAAQAKHFARLVKAAGLGKGDLLPVADVEKAGVTTSMAGAFTVAVEHELGVKPLIYTFPFFARWTTTFGCKLWIAHFDVPKPVIPNPWRRYAAWQHSSSASVPGVQGHCDVNVTSDLGSLVW